MKPNRLTLLAIDVLEMLGNDAPNQAQIDIAEFLLAPLLGQKETLCVKLPIINESLLGD